MNPFNTIYKYNLWIFGSGSGSIAINNKKYIEFLKTFLKNNKINNICDIGCGDWQLAKNIDWTGMNYLGIDCVDTIIKNNLKHSKTNIKFICKDILNYKIPNAELYIIKDVLQHLSNSDITTLINKLTKNNYRFIIIVNDVSTINLNLNIKNGMYRPLDLNKSPFNYTLKSIFEYREPLYSILYIMALSYLIYITYRKKYKLYIIALCFLIFYGICVLPKKKVYLIEKQ